MTALASPAASFIPRTLATAWRRCCGPLPAVLSSPRPPPPATNGAPTTTSTMAAAAREQRSARRPACSATWTWCRGDYERLADFIPNLVHRSAFLTSRSRCCWLPHLRILVRGLRCLRFVIVVIRSCLQWEDSVPARRTDMAGAEGVAAGFVLAAHRGARCVGPPGGPRFDMCNCGQCMQSTSYNCLLAIN
jgi:hypothetical protein